MADSPVLYVYYRPDNDDAYPGVPGRHITEADWARFSPSQRRTVEHATTQEGYTRRKVWLHRDLVDETEQERADREAAEQAARDAYERGNSLVRYREFAPLVPGPGEVIVGSADGPVAQRAVNHDEMPSTYTNPVNTLLAGPGNETLITASCTVTPDTEHFKVGGRGMKITMAGAATGVVRYDIPAGMNIRYSAGVEMWLYVPDPSLITSAQLILSPLPSMTDNWFRTIQGATLVQGWNCLRWGANESRLHDWQKVYQVRFSVTTTAATSVTIGRVATLPRPKASLLFIEDGGYRTFLDQMYPDLVARGIPVTWSLDPMRLGNNVGLVNERITEADVARVAANGNGDSIGFHGYDGAPTSSMTPDQIWADTYNAQRWLSQRGYTGGFWRSAWVQNLATNASAANPLLVAGATYTGISGPMPWPPKDRYAIPRTALHALSPAQMDETFALLKQTHMVWPLYTHGVSDRTDDATPAQWASFIERLDTALAEGWLEGVTLETLMARDGAFWRKGFGEQVYEYYDETGTLRQYRPV